MSATPGKNHAPACSIQGVSRAFKLAGKPVQALDQVSAQVAHGAVTGLVGPDAAGKTTLMRLAVGLLLPDEGSISVLGVEVGQDPQRVQALVGYMPQRFGLYEDLTVKENLDLYADLRDLAPEDRPPRYAELLGMTGMEPFQDRLAGALSGGMKQKLGLACALVKPTEMLILDEPTVGVDPVSRRELWEIVYRLVESEGLSVLLSTSYLDEAERCQEVVLLHQGKVLGQGAPGEFSRRMRGKSFLVKSGQNNRRRLQSLLARGPGVVDSVIQGDGVRLVMDKAAPPDLSGLGDAMTGLQVREEEPRFEDGFLALMGGRRHESQEPELQLIQRGAEASKARDTVIEVEELTKRFGEFVAVDRISFQVKRGEVFGLLGANGAGKSTTFRMLCGLLPPSQGRLRVAGWDLRRAPARARASIGYMAQRFSLYGQLSVRDNLSFFASAYGLGGERRRRMIAWALDEFGLAEVAEAPSAELPLGFKQRLAMAAALMHGPEILFLDEPTSGVDPLARRDFWRRINALAEQKVTVLITTHHLEEAEYCDRMVVMDRGQILARGTPHEMKSRWVTPENPNPSMEDAFIALLEEHRAPKEAA
ncbi:ABC transporter ATP-binding protein [Desulfocarbo indianensis]|nr:ABC transporter ATP-binding protein [Desulfocarbo indianensis]